MHRMIVRAGVVAVIPCFMASCSSSNGDTATDAGHGAHPDSAADTGHAASDAGRDGKSAADAGRDGTSGFDAGADAGGDASSAPDTGRDASAPDGSFDAATHDAATHDAETQDAKHGLDAAKDAEKDADVGVDAPVISGASQWVLGYYVGYDINSYPIADIDWTGITHIAFSPLTVNSDQSLATSFDDSNGTGVADAQAIATAAHAHGVKALLMLGGAGNGASIASAASAAHRTAFVNELISEVATLGYDGLDLDWEDSVVLADFVSLAQALRAAKPDILLSYPGPTINENIDSVDPMMVTLAESLDRFNVQTYYPSTAFAGSGWDSWFVSPLSGASSATPIAIDDSLSRYATAGIPKAKLGMGMAFYAICYSSDITGPRQVTSESTSINGGDNAYPLSLFFKAGGTYDVSPSARKRDAVAMEPFLALTTAVTDSGCNSTPTKYISYDDETAILAKGAFSKAQGYGGIIVWTLEEGWLPAGASGGRAPNALMQALKQGFIDP